MRRHTVLSACAVAAVAAIVLSGCGGENSQQSEAFDPNAKTEITMAGWSLSSSKEFKLLAEGFMKSHPNVTVKFKEYSASDYDTQLLTDLSSGTQPDVFPLKNLKNYYTYAKESDGLANLSDVAKTYDGDKNIDLSPYELDGKYYGLPYRQDVWVLFYNKDMFNKAGVSVPTDKWTWDDFVKTAQELKAKLPAAGYDANQVYPTYLHSWQSVVQGVATAQGGSDALNKFATGDFGYMNPFYETAMKVQNEGLALNYNIVTSNKTQYGAQFTSELAAMMPMGSWEAASVIDDAKTGVGHKFEWGMAPLPQAEGDMIFLMMLRLSAIPLVLLFPVS